MALVAAQGRDGVDMDLGGDVQDALDGFGGGGEGV